MADFSRAATVIALCFPGSTTLAKPRKSHLESWAKREAPRLANILPDRTPPSLNPCYGL